MKTVELIGLVGAGSVSLSFLAGMPSLHVRLGPVKGLSYSSAKRLTGLLRAGYAVEDYKDLGVCSLICIWVPDKSLDRVIQEVASQTPIRHTMVVLCGTDRDSRWAEPLRKRGARVATLSTVGSGKRGPFVAEGHPQTVQYLKKLLSEDGQRMIEIRPSTKALYLAGVYLITDALRPWVAASMDALRDAGFTRAEALTIVEAFGAASLRAQGKAGGKPWSKSDEALLHEVMENRAKTLRSSHPGVAQIYSEGLRLTLDYFQKRKKPIAAAAKASSVDAHPPAAAVNQ